MKKISGKKGINRVITIFLIISLITGVFIGLLFFNNIIYEGTVGGETIIVDSSGSGDYNSIQEAIDAAGTGDSIYVWDGKYFENIVLSKSISLVGNGTSKTTIIGDGSKPVVEVTVNSMSVNGFTIKSERITDTGILLMSVENCNISNNNCSNNINGICLDNSNNNIINNNTILNCNTGLVIENSNSNKIWNNTMISCGVTIVGDELPNWNSNIITDNNTVNGKPIYFWKDINGGLISGGAGQVILANCQNITVEHQNLSNCSIGIQLGYSDNNSIKKRHRWFPERG